MGTLGEHFARRENRCQEPFGRGRGTAVIEPPADRMIKIRRGLLRKIPEAAHAAALVLRAIVARTRSATSSPVR